MKGFIGSFFLMVVSSVFGAILAVLGASMAGMSKSQWSLESLIYLIAGAAVAGFSFLLLLGVLPSGKGNSVLGSAPIAFFGALFLAFLSGFGGIRISKQNQRANVQYHKEQAAQSGRKRDEFHALLRADPGLAVREKWYVANDERRDAYRYSLWQRDVAYSPEELGSLYAASGGRHPESMTEHILAHPAFDPEMLKTEYHFAIRETLETGDCLKLVLLIESPEFELAWLEDLDQSGLLERKDIRCIGSIRESIAKRFPSS